MSRIKSPQLQNLLLQAKFAPEKIKIQQLDACEVLVRIIIPGKSYPFEFICYHITGYHPKHSSEMEVDKLLSYNDLISDLSAYSAILSKTLHIHSESVNHKFLTIKGLTKRFRVSAKTIRRWQENGLIGRFLLFPDGRHRLAFSESTVDFYVQKNRAKVNKGIKYRLVSNDQNQAILLRLSRWASRCPYHRQEAIRRTAKHFNRSYETIRSILIKAETNDYYNIQFKRRAYGISPKERKEIFRLYQQGIHISDLITRFHRSKTNIYRAINIEQAQQVLAQEISYVDCPQFAQTNSESDILTPDANLFNDDMGRPEGNSLSIDVKDIHNSTSTYCSDIKTFQLLNPRQEIFLFRKYNYLKYLAAQMQKRLNPYNPSARDVSKIKLRLRQAHEVKDTLIRSNLRLVVSVARQHANNEMEMSELISDGNLILINAIEKFDFNKGNKLSTYATWALIKRFATFYTRQTKHRDLMAGDEILETVSDLRKEASKIPVLESARKNLEQVICENLEDREQFIVREHYGLIKQTELTGQRKAKSLSQIAKLIGLSKERVRQIELKALQKLRHTLSPDQFDLLTV
ncbi:MAG: sigma-70 family RNA polymerase sigma factor [Sedimentisphaerales bacterium]|nr:sigma-70 family RNA polymerase sigma factor [Sedimentisphaerales bacterium]